MSVSKLRQTKKKLADVADLKFEGREPDCFSNDVASGDASRLLRPHQPQWQQDVISRMPRGLR
jgi:hypothetical protein